MVNVKMVNVKMTIKDRNNYLKKVENEIDSKLSHLYQEQHLHRDNKKSRKISEKIHKQPVKARVDTPLEEAPLKEAPLKEAPLEEAQLKEAPLEAPLKEAPLEPQLEKLLEEPVMKPNLHISGDVPLNLKNQNKPPLGLGLGEGSNPNKKAENPPFMNLAEKENCLSKIEQGIKI
jgi:hypothetical protein